MQGWGLTGLIVGHVLFLKHHQKVSKYERVRDQPIQSRTYLSFDAQRKMTTRLHYGCRGPNVLLKQEYSTRGWYFLKHAASRT